ncbi:nucleoside 2-deoxyribosyltransferase [Vagococcus hydrophili]|uniref:Nucleoside 2-deoxyribosyltransferase n=1 Tax=Vagococcus hydrophili TaxID=2714947 RepID=A0A6G8AS46_9ENTE|nr:nucleoside 2-deoxyribosyltransferase [Vagococcus hydrophili]QIL47745.1 nucleoside 2-deoxyribosyltransferase [Vagococcus hydrophili]
MTKQIYFASPLFSDMERRYNDYLVSNIRKKYPNEQIYVPQEQGDINDKESYADSMMIAKYDTDALLNSKLVVAVLDGASIDVGVASEIGVAYQAGIPVLGLFTDSRQQGATNKQKITALNDVAESQFPYVNLYTAGLIKLNGQIINNEQEWLEVIETYL